MFSTEKQLSRILKLLLEGHIKVPGGPHVARGPDVAQAWVNAFNFNRKLREKF
jgi:hypothetical protein